MPVAPSRWRVADIAVFADEIPAGKYPSTPPRAVIELLSPDDSLSEVIDKFREYRAWGVSDIWLVDPDHQTIHYYDGSSLLAVDSIEFADRGLRIPLSQIFD